MDTTGFATSGQTLPPIPSINSEISSGLPPLSLPEIQQSSSFVLPPVPSHNDTNTGNFNVVTDDYFSNKMYHSDKNKNPIDLIKDLPDKNGVTPLLTDEQVKQLKLVYQTIIFKNTGEPVIDIENGDVLTFISEFIADMGYNMFYDYYTSSLWDSSEEFMFESPVFLVSQIKIKKDLENFHSETTTKGIYTCRCGSDNTTVIAAQTRSLDEAQSVAFICGDCQKRSHVQ